MMRLLALLLCLASGQAWAATGSAAADTFYVRPVEDCTFNGDGLSFACAASNGAAGAFKGFSNLSWTNTTGIDDGDTLKLCGTFYDTSSKTAGSRMLSIEGSGSAGSLITIDGDCSAYMVNPGSFTSRQNVRYTGAILDGQNTVDHGLRTLANTYIRFRNLVIQNFDQRGMVLYNSASADITIAKFITVEASVLVTGIRNASLTADGIDARGSDITIDGPTVTNIGEDAVYLKGARNIVRNLNIFNPSQDGVLGDCLQFDTEVTGSVVTNLYCDHRMKDSKQCLVANGFTDSPVWSINGVTCLMPIGATSAIGLLLEGTQVNASGIYVSGGNYGIVAQDIAGNSVTVTGSVVSDVTTACTSTGNNPTLYALFNNSLNNCGVTGIEFGSATNTRKAQNNVVRGSFARGINKGTSGTTESYNDIYGPTTPVLSNGTATTLGTGDIQVDPQWLGGSSPSGPYGFKPKPTSPLVRAGTPVGAYRAFNCGIEPGNPSIGAFERCAGDAR